MLFGTRQLRRAAAMSALISVLSLPQGGFAQNPDHIVTPGEMLSRAAEAGQQRQENLDTLNQFFASDKAHEALKSAGIDPQQVKSAMPSLSDQELAQLARRADNAQRDFAAGNMTDHDLLLILVIVAVLILVIVAVR